MKHGDKVRDKILKKGLKLWPNVSASAVARAAGLNSHSVVLYHFTDLKTAIAEYAVSSGCSRVIAQLIAVDHKAIKKMSQDERAKHLKAIS